jgi:hypothetical protein
MKVKICLVSPELQRINYEDEVLLLKNWISKSLIDFDAICTKYPNIWTGIK